MFAILLTRILKMSDPSNDEEYEEAVNASAPRGSFAKMWLFGLHFKIVMHRISQPEISFVEQPNEKFT